MNKGDRKIMQFNKIPKCVGKVEYQSSPKIMSLIFNEVYYYYDRYRHRHVYSIASHPFCIDGYVYYTNKYIDINTAICEMLDNSSFIRWKNGGILKNQKNDTQYETKTNFQNLVIN